MLMVQSVVADINRRTGESECQYYKDRLLYTEDGLKDGLIDRSRTLSCHGELKNNRGLVSRFLYLLSIYIILSLFCSLCLTCVVYKAPESKCDTLWFRSCGGSENNTSLLCFELMFR